VTPVDPADRSIVDGATFTDHPDHILGTEVGRDGGDDDQTRKPRWGYQVVGRFERLPDLVERPMCGACAMAHDTVTLPSAPPAGRSGGPPARGQHRRLSEPAASAVALGLRVDRYLAALSAQSGRSAKPGGVQRTLSDSPNHAARR